MNDAVDSAAVELLINDGLPLLQRHARQLHRRYRDLIECEELESHGYVGLRQAAERFDPTRGIPFQRYAWYRIDGEMRRALKRRVRAAHAREAGRQAVTLLGDDADVLNDDEGRHRRRLTQFCDAVFAAMLSGAVSHASAGAGRSYEQADERLDLQQAASSLGEALAAVDPEVAVIIRRHYFNGENLRDIADDLGMSYATARRRHQAGLVSLGKALRALRAKQRSG